VLFLRRIYGLLLTLYPREYRSEFGEEVQMVFNSSLDDATKSGSLEPIVFFMHELLSLPKAILYEHLRARRRAKMTGKFASRFDFPQGSRMEPWVVLLPFVLTYVLYRSTIYLYVSFLDMPFWIKYLIGLTLFGSIVGMCVAGLRLGAPRWSLPFLGFVFSIVNLLASTIIINPDWRGFPFLFQAPRFIRGFVYEGLIWSSMFVLIILLVLFTALIPRLRPFYQRLKDDWTLLAFVIYGAIPFAIILTFDDYQGERPYVLIADLILAIGGWFYLHTQVLWKRYLILFIGLAMSMAVAAAGKWILYAPTPGFGFTKFSEMLGTVITWIWLALFMLTPLALNLLPGAKNHSQMPEAVM